MSEEHHFDDHKKGLGHIVSQRTYRIVFASLLVLTVITVGAAQIDFGQFNLVVAILIATVKASLVLLFFMHLKFEEHAIWLYAFFPVIILGLLIGGIFLDNPYRPDLGVKVPLVTESVVSGKVVKEHDVVSEH